MERSVWLAPRLSCFSLAAMVVPAVGVRQRERATVLFSLLLPSSRSAGLLVCFEGAQAAVSPCGGELGRRARIGIGILLSSAPELVGEVHHGAEQGGAVVADASSS